MCIRDRTHTGHRNNIFQVKGSRVDRLLVQIDSLPLFISVSRGYHKQHPGIFHSIVKLLVKFPRSEAEVADGRALGLRIADGLRHVFRRSHAVLSSQHL